MNDVNYFVLKSAEEKILHGIPGIIAQKRRDLGNDLDHPQSPCNDLVPKPGFEPGQA